MSSPLAARIAHEHAAQGDALSGAARQRAIEALQARGLPTSRDENWKYANLRPLERVRFAPVTGPHEPLSSLSTLPALIGDYARYTFVDGNFSPSLSRITQHAGLSVHFLRDAETSTSSDNHDDMRFALLNEAFVTDG